ncbi:MAG: type II toxin-antitoxin system RelE/ParE family toxin [Chloroflexi bacterium]|nr:type II toxin-antitoxin system RelE/ParE family toxin [Chloroflexota bacterium]
MAYRVEIPRTAQKQVLSLPPDARQAISQAIDRLKDDPRPQGCRKLRETGLWRIRVGRYRVVYAIDDKDRSVLLIKVAQRREDTY